MEPTDTGRVRATRPATRRRPRDPRGRAVAAALAAIAWVLAAVLLTGCVGKRGRNDDVVRPGSDGRPRVEVSIRLPDVRGG